MDGWTDGRMEDGRTGQKDGRMEGRTDGETDGRTDRTPPSPHHPPVPTVGPHAIVNPYAHQNNQCWRGHQRATLLGQLVADASSVYTFACQIYYNRLLMLHWAATARMAAEGGGAGGPVHAHVEHGRLRVAVEVSPKCAAAGA